MLKYSKREDDDVKEQDYYYAYAHRLRTILISGLFYALSS
jgi:hypothetical protein